MLGHRSLLQTELEVVSKKRDSSAYTKVFKVCYIQNDLILVEKG